MWFRRKTPPAPRYVASRPAGLRVSLWHHTFYWPKSTLKKFVPAVLLAALALACAAFAGHVAARKPGHDAASILAAAWTAMVFPGALAAVFWGRHRRWWRRLKWHFHDGCLTAAVVLEPPDRQRLTTVAVYTDLGRAGPESSTPVVKVCRVKLGRAGDAVPPPGGRLATVSSYVGPFDASPQWRTFNAVPACQATGDAAEWARCEALLEDQYAELAAALARLTPPLAPGQYPVPPAAPPRRPATPVSLN